jgi:hypothetical protein
MIESKIKTKHIIAELSVTEKICLYNALYEDLAGKGTEGDTELAHVNKAEMAVLRDMGGSGTINPNTGLIQFMGGGSPPPPPPSNTSVSQTSEFPDELKPFIQDVLGKSQAIQEKRESEGYIPFEGPQIAEFSPEQEQAFTGIQGLVGQGQEYFDPSADLAKSSTGAYTPEAVRAAMSPFTQNVVDIQQREALRQADVAQQRLAAQAVGAGGLGGSRMAILEAEQNRNTQQLLSDIQLRGQAAAFEDAQTRLAQQSGRELAASGQLMNLGSVAPQQSLKELTAVEAIGAQKQAQTQQALNIAKSQFQEEQTFPEQTLQQYQSVIRGFPFAPSTYTNSQTVTPAPSYLQQAAGLGVTGLGLAGAFGGFGKRASQGGLVSRMQGGSVDQNRGLGSIVVKRQAGGNLEQTISNLNKLRQQGRLSSSEYSNRFRNLLTQKDTPDVDEFIPRDKAETPAEYVFSRLGEKIKSGGVAALETLVNPPTFKGFPTTQLSVEEDMEDTYNPLRRTIRSITGTPAEMRFDISNASTSKPAPVVMDMANAEQDNIYDGRPMSSLQLRPSDINPRPPPKDILRESDEERFKRILGVEPPKSFEKRNPQFNDGKGSRATRALTSGQQAAGDFVRDTGTQMVRDITSLGEYLFGDIGKTPLSLAQIRVVQEAEGNRPDLAKTGSIRASAKKIIENSKTENIDLSPNLLAKSLALDLRPISEEDKEAIARDTKMFTEERAVGSSDSLRNLARIAEGNAARYDIDDDASEIDELSALANKLTPAAPAPAAPTTAPAATAPATTTKPTTIAAAPAVASTAPAVASTAPAAPTPAAPTPAARATALPAELPETSDGKGKEIRNRMVAEIKALSTKRKDSLSQREKSLDKDFWLSFLNLGTRILGQPGGVTFLQAISKGAKDSGILSTLSKLNKEQRDIADKLDTIDLETLQQEYGLSKDEAAAFDRERSYGLKIKELNLRKEIADKELTAATTKAERLAANNKIRAAQARKKLILDAIKPLTKDQQEEWDKQYTSIVDDLMTNTKTGLTPAVKDKFKSGFFGGEGASRNNNLKEQFRAELNLLKIDEPTLTGLQRQRKAFTKIYGSYLR